MSNPVIDSEGNKYWYNDKNELHRVEGPAIEGADGSRHWFVDGKCHRLDGPSYEGVDGSKDWMVEGKLHRLDGPAYEGADGSKEWWVDDEQVTERDYPEAVLLYKCRMVLES